MGLCIRLIAISYSRILKMWFYLKCYNISIFSALFNYWFSLFWILFGCEFFCLFDWLGFGFFLLLFFNTDKSYSVQKEKKIQHLSHTVRLTHTRYYFMDSRNLTDSVWDRVVSLLKKGYIQHWWGQQNLAFRFSINEKGPLEPQ